MQRRGAEAILKLAQKHHLHVTVACLDPLAYCSIYPEDTVATATVSNGAGGTIISGGGGVSVGGKGREKAIVPSLPTASSAAVSVSVFATTPQSVSGAGGSGGVSRMISLKATKTTATAAATTTATAATAGVVANPTVVSNCPGNGATCGRKMLQLSSSSSSSGSSNTTRHVHGGIGSGVDVEGSKKRSVAVVVNDGADSAAKAKRVKNTTTTTTSHQSTQPVSNKKGRGGISSGVGGASGGTVGGLFNRALKMLTVDQAHSEGQVTVAVAGGGGRGADGGSSDGKKKPLRGKRGKTGVGGIKT
jgi:hypothetical protein